MIDYAYGDVDLNTLRERLRQSLVLRDSQPTSVPEATSIASSNLNSLSYNSNTSSLRSASNPTPTDSSSAPAAPPPSQATSRQATATPHSSTPRPSDAAEKSKQSSMSESSSSHQPHSRYLDELRRKRMQEAEERQRILKLLQDDRQERKSRNHDFGTRISSDSSRPEKKATKSKDMHHHSDSALAIRLFDGSSIKQRFSLDATLGDVRVWIDSHRTDGDVPYSIISQFPLKIFSASDENETLVALDLHPTATLILKPVSNFSSAFTPTTTVGRLQQGVKGGVRWALGAIGTFLGYGYQPVESESQETFRVPNLAAHEPPDNSEWRSRSSSPQTLNDITEDGDSSDRRTYNGNQLNLEDDN